MRGDAQPPARPHQAHTRPDRIGSPPAPVAQPARLVYRHGLQFSRPTLHNPPHPGLALCDAVLPALGLSVTDAAAQLGVSRVSLSRVINGRAAVSPMLALRLEAWLGVDRGGAARLWLAQQAAYDEWTARKAIKTKPLRIRPALMPA
jgi:addiction module HigA family antidote